MTELEHVPDASLCNVGVGAQNTPTSAPGEGRGVRTQVTVP